MSPRCALSSRRMLMKSCPCSMASSTAMCVCLAGSRQCAGIATGSNARIRAAPTAASTRTAPKLMHLGPALAGRCAMNTLREAAQEYLSMRRHLGFKLHDAGRGLLDFVAFMEQRQAPFITQALALAWAQRPMNVQPAHWAKRLSFVRGFARHRSATDPRTQVPSPGLLPFQPKRATPYLYSDE